MAKKGFTIQEIREQQMELAKVNGKSSLNESTNSAKNSTILSYKKAPDGRIYGIIRENSKYFIKVASGKKENPNVTDFAYIGGLQNKINERFDTFNDADRRLHLKMISLHEAFEQTSMVEIDIPLNKDIDKEKAETAPAEETPTETTPAPAEAPVSTEPAPETTPTEEPAAETTPAPEASTEETPAPESTPTDGEKPEGKTKDIAGNIASYLGKLTQAYTEQGDVDEKQAKTAINTIISATAPGIAKMDDTEKEKITKRIENNGEKLDEEELSPEDEVQAIKELNEAIKNKTIDSFIKKIIKEEKEKLEEKEFEEVVNSLDEEDFIELVKVSDDAEDKGIEDDEPIHEDDTYMKKIQGIAEESKKMAVSFIKEKYADKANTVISENFDVLDEASIADAFTKAGLGKIYDKAKGFFNKKGAEKLINSTPELKKTYDNAVDAVDSLKKGDTSAWTTFVNTVRMPLLKVTMALMILNGTIAPAFAQSMEKDNLIPKGTTELVDNKGGAPGEQGAGFDKADQSQASLNKLYSTKDLGQFTNIKKLTPHRIEATANVKGATEKTDTVGYKSETPEIAKVNPYSTDGKFDKDKVAVGKDSEELGEKYAWIKDAMSKLPNDSTGFADGFKQVQADYANRFKDSEVKMEGGKILFDHRFLDNDNIAADNYKTEDGQILKGGSRIPQNTKVVDFKAGDVVKGEQEKTGPSSQKAVDLSEITSRKVTIKKDVLKEKAGVYKKLKQELAALGFNVTDSQDFITIQQTPFWTETQNMDQTIAQNNEHFDRIGKSLGVDLTNMFRPSENVITGGGQ